MELHEYILRKAKEAGICKPWADMIAQGMSAGQLLKLYREGIDFCLEHNFPTNDDLVRLGGPLLVQAGIYIDATVHLSNSDFTVLLGKSHAAIEYSGYGASQLFVKHNSACNVSAADNAFIMIDCFDSAQVTVAASGNSRVIINVYGSAKVTTTINDSSFIKVVNKNKETY
ncbi:hypothetical protein A0256_23115 [Mucilaginibacter sp. PAMC 26640]|nr:hypothetical protein A0256_23115 [Mucilaginibacter sp. PAMC 26640]